MCGYAPLASDIVKALQRGWGDEEPPPPKLPTTVAGGNDEGAGAADPALEDGAAVEPAAPGMGSNSMIASADGVRSAEVIDDADSPAR